MSIEISMKSLAYTIEFNGITTHYYNYGPETIAFFEPQHKRGVFEGKVVLVTGGTGFIGSSFCRKFLDEGAKKVISFSRRWNDSEKLRNQLGNDPRLRCINGDIADYQALLYATKGVDYILHTAAYKAVDSAEYNSQECTRVNVVGSINVINAAIENRVKGVFGISTDKACAPINTYGRTKALMESLFINANSLGDTAFSVARYANVAGSSGSVMHKFANSLADNGGVSVTHPDMTRFYFSQGEAVEFVYSSFVDMIESNERGLVYIPKMQSATAPELAQGIANYLYSRDGKHVIIRIDVVGVRPGEKMHESMIDKAEVANDIGDRYVIYPPICYWDKNQSERGDKLPAGTEYTSFNTERFTPEELQGLIHEVFKS